MDYSNRLLPLVCSWLALLLSASVSSADTRLIDAVKAGNRSAIATLLMQAVDVNAPEADGTTALHWAARADDGETVRALLRSGANANVANRNRITPLSLAAGNGNAGLIDAFVKAGADVNVELPYGQTALMMAARGGHRAAVDTLLAHGANVNAREQTQGETALIWAAAADHAEVVTSLISHGADVNGRSKALTFPRQEFGDGKSARLTVLPKGSWVPLMYAARQNSLKALRALAGAGANLDATDPDGVTALVVAVINAHYDAAALLLELGANPNIGDVTGMTPLYAAVDLNTFADTPGRPMPRPSGRLDTVAVVKALLAHEADPNLALTGPILVRVHDRGDATLGAGATPLMRAAKKGDIEMMRLLLAHGADASRRTRTGAEALMYAAGFGGAGRFTIYEDKQATESDFMETASLCLDHGADVNAVNASGETALHFAAGARGAPFIKLLLSRGAVVDLKDKDGRTPLDIATGGGGRRRGGEPAPVREDVAALLRQPPSR